MVNIAIISAITTSPVNIYIWIDTSENVALNKNIFLRMLSPSTKGLYCKYVLSAEDMVSKGKIVFEKSIKIIPIEIEPKAADCFVVKRYPIVIPIRIKNAAINSIIEPAKANVFQPKSWKK